MNKLFAILFCCFCIIVKAQNIVPNPSFDDIRGRRPSLFPWTMINSIDFFVYDESKKEQRITTNVRDKNFRLRPARTGKAYAGLRVWTNYYEFLQVELKEELIRNQKYYFEFYVIISDHSNSLLNSLGASFYEIKPPYINKSAFVNYPPQVLMFDKKGIGHNNQWTKVYGEFYARGNERFLTIGNFSTEKFRKFEFRRFNFKRKEAYYYIDDVLLQKISHDTLKENITVDSNQIDSILADLEHEILSNFGISRYIVFPENSTDLTFQSYNQLANYINYMLQNPEAELTLVANFYKDNNEEDISYKLAAKRARAVQIFLSGNRITRQRIHIIYNFIENDGLITQLNINKSNIIELLLSDNKIEKQRIEYFKKKQ